MPTSNSDLTYRIWGLPFDASVRDSEKILSALFDREGEEKTNLKVHSLGLDPYKFGRTVRKVATVTFELAPKDLSGDGPWNFFAESHTYRPGSDTKFPLSVDTHFLGFTPLNCVKDDEEHRTDFVAVSGLSSHPFGSWKQRNGKYMWLRDALACNPQGARVLLYGYDTGLVKSESFQDIDDIGKKLGFSIGRIRLPQPNEMNYEPRPITFIAHSLGGLVVKEAIYHLAYSDPVNYQSVHGLLFFGVPNRGIEISHWLPIVNNQPNESLIRNLAPDSIYLRGLHNRFAQVFRNYDSRVVSIYETMKSRTAKEEHPGVWALTGKTSVLVSRESAIDCSPSGPKHSDIGFNQNHADLAKFSGPFDTDYRHVESFLDEFRRDAVAIQERFRNQTYASSGPSWEQQNFQTATAPERLTNLAPLGQNSPPETIGAQYPFANRQMARSPFDPSPHRMQSPPQQASKRAVKQQGGGGSSQTKQPRFSKNNKEYTDERDTFGMTPLMWAVGRGDKTNMQELLDSGGDIDATDILRTGLIYLAEMKNEELLKLLLKRGADESLATPFVTETKERERVLEEKSKNFEAFKKAMEELDTERKERERVLEEKSKDLEAFKKKIQEAQERFDKKRKIEEKSKDLEAFKKQIQEAQELYDKKQKIEKEEMETIKMQLEQANSQTIMVFQGAILAMKEQEEENDQKMKILLQHSSQAPR